MATGGETQESIPSLELGKELSFAFVIEITENFSSERKICADLFGKVYKGSAPYSNKEIAVKILEPITSDETFRDYVQKIMDLNHENIVELIGFCCETQTNLEQIDGKFVDGSQNLLCYQYLPWSLHRYLFGSKAVEGSSSVKPSVERDVWDARFIIVKGICQGLHYLHKSDPSVIHMNLKLENIWLDDTMVPKIVNVGLSRLFDQEHTRRYTKDESFRYMAPEYLSNGEITTGIDIYSLGVMIIQITTGEENCGSTDDRASRKYIDQIRRDWTAEHIASKYPSLDSECLHQVHACIKTGLECVQIDQRNRPSIDEIVDRLNTI